VKPLHRQLAALLVGASLAWPCAGAFAASQLFKCVDGGRTIYQQQACAPSTQPEVAASAPPVSAKPGAPGAMANTAAPLGEAVSVAPRKLKASSSPASAAPATPR
jgi:hypothetical protein